MGLEFGSVFERENLHFSVDFTFQIGELRRNEKGKKQKKMWVWKVCVLTKMGHSNHDRKY